MMVVRYSSKSPISSAFEPMAPLFHCQKNVLLIHPPHRHVEHPVLPFRFLKRLWKGVLWSPPCAIISHKLTSVACLLRWTTRQSLNSSRHCSRTLLLRTKL